MTNILILEVQKSVTIESNALVNDGTDYFERFKDIEAIDHNSLKPNANENESITNVKI